MTVLLCRWKILGADGERLVFGTVRLPMPRMTQAREAEGSIRWRFWREPRGAIAMSAFLPTLRSTPGVLCRRSGAFREDLRTESRKMTLVLDESESPARVMFERLRPSFLPHFPRVA